CYHAARYATHPLIFVQVVVPSGLRRAPPLRSITNEFSTEMWLATAVAFLAVSLATVWVTWKIFGLPLTAALAAAPLQILGPLLGQSPPSAAAHRPLSAVWLLMSVVLAAAYQGLLLRELTTPPGEINSLEQLKQSGLEVRVSRDLYMYASHFPSAPWRSQKASVPHVSLDSVVRTMAEKRSFALVLQEDMHIDLLLKPYTTPPKRLHAFRVAFAYPSSQFSFSKGSPLAKSVEMLALRTLENGLESRMALVTSLRMHLPYGDDERRTRPLNLHHVWPAFFLLAQGLSLSALVFVCEAAYWKWINRKQRS
ncbi:Ionotropic receptor 209, partial [Frankliniella occidentalis]